MVDEVAIVIPGENLAQAEMDAASAAMDAERAARDAEMAAAAAAGATIAQGQLIGQVMEHAREDARESAGDAADAATEAEQAAEVAVAVNMMTAEQYQEICRRLDALEKSSAEQEVQEATPAIAEIGGEEQQTSETQPAPESTPEGNPPTERRSQARRKHGRRGR